MNVLKVKKVLQFSIDFRLKSCLMLRSGLQGEFTDSSIERTPDKQNLYINGYVWSSLMRRAMQRAKAGFASKVGKYKIGEKFPDNGVSPLWCESSFVPLPETDARTGIKINRKYGSEAVGALYSDEIVPPGLTVTLKMNCFCEDENEGALSDLKKSILSSIWVINEGIENIGGGWSYGFGRLEFLNAKCKTLVLTDENDRNSLWKFDFPVPVESIDPNDLATYEVVKPDWKKYTVKAKIADGQLLAVHSSYLLSGSYEDYEKYSELPDTFVFRRYRFDDSGKLLSETVLPGKAIRQTLLSSPLERKLRSLGHDICATPGEICTCSKCSDHNKTRKDKERAQGCTCERCNWFGSTDKGGIIAVMDASVENPNPVMINRVQLCEHSMQNMNLFSGEYLAGGTFSFDVFVDCSRKEAKPEELINEINLLFDEMQEKKNAPPGWYRMGATSTCTGQFKVTGVE